MQLVIVWDRPADAREFLEAVGDASSQLLPVHNGARDAASGFRPGKSATFVSATAGPEGERASVIVRIGSFAKVESEAALRELVLPFSVEAH
jgi:hypothetical protein